MKMDWDEGPRVEGPYGPYRQSERKPIYKEAADKLIAQGVAYPCFCTPEELDVKRAEAEAAGLDPKYDGTWRDADPVEVKKKMDAGEPYTIRFKVPEGKVVSIEDVVRGTVTWHAEDCLGDFIILRSNGMPVYNFCVAVDDASMKITTVVRAEEHLSNTLRQLLVLEAMGHPHPTYAHCSLILGSDRSKLSKRHGAASVQQFSDLGFLPAAMMNYLANLGWNDGTDKEIYTPEELIAAFDLSRVVKSAAVFDMDKLKWVNAQHLKLLPEGELERLVCKHLTAPATGEAMFSPGLTDAATLFVAQGVKLAKKDMEVINDAQPLMEKCFGYVFCYTTTSSSSLFLVCDLSLSLSLSSSIYCCLLTFSDTT
jgi:glutamyl-tRNA synthetase